jgi:NAD(P)-dependent dehydrogenase (short-subunit alcohol dehydrogenase family)
MKPLEGRVAVVAGATRGAGRGIARMLGEAGAIVYCSGRSSRGQPNTTTHHYAGRPETIEETAEQVTAAGGAGIAVRVDHTVDAEVAALFARVKKEQHRLDVLVNILTGKPVASWKSFWKLPLDEGRAFVDGWLWPHVVTCWHAAPLMVARQSGLMVEIIEQDGIGYHGQFFFDLMEISLKRLSAGWRRSWRRKAWRRWRSRRGSCGPRRFSRASASPKRTGARPPSAIPRRRSGGSSRPRRRALSGARSPRWRRTRT